MDILAISEDLRSLKSTKPNSQSRARVAAALSSKFEGVQSLAAQVLGAWGDDDSVDLLKRWSDTLQSREYGWAIRGVAMGALADCVRAKDADWVLDRFLASAGAGRLAFREVVRSLPWEHLAPRLTQALSSDDGTARRAAAMAWVWARPSGWLDQMRILSSDPDPQISKMARFHLENPEREEESRRAL